LIQQEVLKLVMEARAAGATVFLSSHILSEVEATTDRVGIIRQGIVVEIASTSTLVNRSLRRVRVRFRQAVDPDGLLHLSGVKLLAKGDGLNLSLQVEGDMDSLIKALAAYPVVDFETERPSLEEIFLAYYEKDINGGGK
jgi:ABC-2 type transport system ATP-binding protein